MNVLLFVMSLRGVEKKEKETLHFKRKLYKDSCLSNTVHFCILCKCRVCNLPEINTICIKETEYDMETSYIIFCMPFNLSGYTAF